MKETVYRGLFDNVADGFIPYTVRFLETFAIGEREHVYGMPCLRTENGFQLLWKMTGEPKPRGECYPTAQALAEYLNRCRTYTVNAER